MNILFFSHNKKHHQFFQGVGAKIVQDGISDSTVRFLTDSEHVPTNSAGNTNLGIMAEFDRISDISAGLKRIEQEYPSFQPLKAMTGDRILNFFPRYLGLRKIALATQEKLMVATFRFFEDNLDSNPTSIIFSELVIGFQDAILQAVAEKRGIPYVGIRASKLEKGTVFCDPFTEIPFGFNETLGQFADDAAAIPSKIKVAAQKHLSNVRGEYELPAYMKETSCDASYVERHHVRRFFEAFFVDRRLPKDANFFYFDVWKRMRYWLVRKKNIFQLRSRRGQRLFADPASLEGKKYVIFPLQFEPEATTLIRAYPYVDQISLVKILAKMLPYGVQLAVKEHRGNEGYRKIRDYEELYYEANIVLLPRAMNVGELVRKSIGVVTLSGRMGWEAIVLGKPAFVLGRAFWSQFFAARRLSGPEGFRAAFADWQLDASGKAYSDDDLVAYAGAYMAHTYPGVFIGKNPSLLTEENIVTVAKSIGSFAEGLLSNPGTTDTAPARVLP